MASVGTYKTEKIMHKNAKLKLMLRFFVLCRLSVYLNLINFDRQIFLASQCSVLPL